MIALIEDYPANTLEGLICRRLVQAITEQPDYCLISDLEPISNLISGCRALIREAGWPSLYEHNFLVRLKTDLTSLTHGHPVTRQFVTLLELETEFN
jgi:hypothetical protein